MSIYLAMAERDARQAWAKHLPKSRDCEVCPRTAWMLEAEVRDGHRVESYVCANGHLKITQERANVVWGGGDVPQQQET